MVCVCDLVYGEEKVAYVERYVAADLRVEHDVAHCSFPHSVEVDAYEVAVLVDDRAS